MNDEQITHKERLQRNQHLTERISPTSKKDSDTDGTEGVCQAFGFLRGIRERADAGGNFGCRLNTHVEVPVEPCAHGRPHPR